MKPHKGVLITGTDTGVGKTIITGLLGRYLADKGYKVITQKWVQTGSRDFLNNGDIARHLKLMKRQRSQIKDYLPHLVPYSFDFAASPHLAAAREKASIRAAKIKAAFKFLLLRFDVVIVEGLGGALVPLNKKNLLIDIARELKLPAIIVAANKLGAINHTLLTVEAIKSRGMKIIGIIFNNQSKSDRVILDDNMRIIKQLSQERILGVLPWVKDKEDLFKFFAPIGNKILKNE